MTTILSINNYHYRRDGCDSIFLEQNRLLSERGWNVVPFAMRHSDNAPTPWDAYFVGENELGRRYGTWERVVRASRVVYSFEARANVRRLLANARPDVAHCHNIYHHLSPSILSVLKGSDVPTVMTLHDLKIACPAYHMHDGSGPCERCVHGGSINVVKHRCIKGSLALSGLVLIESLVHGVLGSYRENVDLFVAPCRFYIDKLAECGWPRERFVHIPNFVHAPGSTGAPRVGRSILYFGRLSPEKGLRTLIEAAARSGIGIRIAGHGPQSPELRALAEALGADVRFLGHLDADGLREEIAASRATVLPAEWYENAPSSILESYALSKPAIGARIGGIPELVEHGVTGWLFESGSVDRLADTLDQVAALPDAVLADMGEAAWRLARREFSAENYVDRLTDAYRGLGLATPN